MSESRVTQEQEAQSELRLDPLPSSWRWSEIETAGAFDRNAIVDGPFGSNLKLSDYVDGGPVPVLTTRNIDGNLDGVRYISQDKFEELKRSAVRPNDILMAKIGSCGKVGAYPPDGPTAIIPANLLKVTVNDYFDRDFVLYYFKSARFQSYLKTIIKATAQPAFGVTAFKRLPLPVAPKNEQRRIVSKIDELFSRIDAGERALERVQKLLERYRQSVLKAAVTGELTRAWREKHQGQLRSGEVLLQRVLEARRAAWEKAELEKMQAKGVKPADDKWKLRYQEPTPPDTADLPELPSGWVWISVAAAGSTFTGSTPPTSNKAHFGGELPFLKPTDLDQGYEVKQFRQSLTAAGAMHCHVLPPMAVLVTCIGATIGKVGLSRMSCATNQQINALVVDQAFFSPKFVYWFFEGPYGKQQVIGRASATTLPILNKSRFEMLAIPVPPLDEQDRIVAEIEQRLSATSRLVEDTVLESRRSRSFREAVLKAAFAGRLVPQKAEDEAASLLLQRIADDRQTHLARKRTLKERAARTP